MTALTLKIAGHAETLRAARVSFEALAAALDPAGEVGKRLAELVGGFVDGSSDGRDLFRCEVSADATGGALELVGLQILPSQALLELVTAFAVEREDVSLVFRHGWPILSVGRVAAPTIAKAGGESIAPGGGAA